MKRILLTLSLVALLFSADAQQKKRQFFYRIINAQPTASVPVLSAAPTISGSDLVGAVLTSTTGTWTNTPSSYAYQWYRNGVAIGGATSSTYTSLAADSYIDVNVTCGVTASNASGAGSQAVTANYQVVVNPTTITNRYYAAKHEGTTYVYTSTAKTTPASNGGGVVTWEDLVADSDLDYDGSITGPGQIQTDFDYGSTQPYPEFHDYDGGFNEILNSNAQRYQSSPNFSPSYTGEVSSYFYLVPTGGTDNEYINFVTNGEGWRDRDEGTGNSTQVGYTSASGNIGTAQRVLPGIVYKKNFIEIYRNATGDAQFYVNNIAYGSTVNIGTNGITEFAFGSNSHNATVANFAGALIAGPRDAVKAGQLYKYWQKRYGASGTYFTGFPYITHNTGDVYNDKETWNGTDKSINAASYVFRSSIGAAEGATEFRLYGSTSSTQATAIGTKFLVATKIKGVDADPGKFIRGTHYGVAPGTATNVWYWIEIIAVDEFGNRQPFATNGGGILDNQL